MSYKKQQQYQQFRDRLDHIFNKNSVLKYFNSTSENGLEVSNYQSSPRDLQLSNLNTLQQETKVVVTERDPFWQIGKQTNELSCVISLSAMEGEQQSQEVQKVIHRFNPKLKEA